MSWRMVGNVVVFCSLTGALTFLGGFETLLEEAGYGGALRRTERGNWSESAIFPSLECVIVRLLLLMLREIYHWSPPHHCGDEASISGQMMILKKKFLLFLAVSYDGVEWLENVTVHRHHL